VIEVEAAGRTSNRADKIIYTTKEAELLGIKSIYPPPEPEKCKFCGKTLYYEGVYLCGMIVTWRTNIPERCNCEKAKLYWKRQEQMEIQKKNAEKAKEDKNKIDLLIQKSGIPKRYLGKTFEAYEQIPESKRAYAQAKYYADNFKKFAENGNGLYLEGTYGTGKTHFAIAIALQLLNQGISVTFRTAVEMFEDIKAAYDGQSDYSEVDKLSVYKKTPLLIIDDLGKEQCTEWSVSILNSILNERYVSMLPTIITTNYNESDLINKLTPRNGDSSNIRAIISRSHECNTVITMAWEDYRGKKMERLKVEI
jgi:DNA replication protein DnaC